MATHMEPKRGRLMGPLDGQLMDPLQGHLMDPAGKGAQGVSDLHSNGVSLPN
jgi:hypothetical protein